MKITAIELIGFLATAPGAGPTAATAFAGDSLVVKNSDGPRILQWWADHQTAGFQQLVANSFHDTTRGLRLDVPTTEVLHRMPIGVGQPLQPMEAIGASISGSVTAGDIEQGVLMIGYEKLPGISQRFIGIAELKRRIENVVTIRASLAVTAAGGWTGSETMAADSDLLHGSTDYAVLGAVVGTECAAVTFKGPDTGNTRIGLPGRIEAEGSMDYFLRLSAAWDSDLIPLINSNNRNATFFEAAQDENAAAVTVSWILAELKNAGR
jgi:hypothetical protein